MPGIPFLSEAASSVGTMLGGIFKGIQGGKQQRMANKIHPQDVTYTESQYAKNQLGAVNQAYNSRSAGAANAEENIGFNQANSFAGVERNATSGSQALAVLAGLQGQSNQAYTDLASKEAQSHQALLGELGMANSAMTNENDKIYNDKLRKYNNDLNAKNALQNAAWKNKGAMVDDLITSHFGGGGDASGGGNGGLNPFTTADTGQGSYSMTPGMTSSTGYINPFIR